RDCSRFDRRRFAVGCVRSRSRLRRIRSSNHDAFVVLVCRSSRSSKDRGLLHHDRAGLLRRTLFAGHAADLPSVARFMEFGDRKTCRGLCYHRDCFARSVCRSACRTFSNAELQRNDAHAFQTPTHFYSLAKYDAQETQTNDLAIDENGWRLGDVEYLSRAGRGAADARVTRHARFRRALKEPYAERAGDRLPLKSPP